MCPSNIWYTALPPGGDRLSHPCTTPPRDCLTQNPTTELHYLSPNELIPTEDILQ